jgi:cytosine deaminase
MNLPPVNLRPGDPAELLAVRATTLREAVACAPAERMVFSQGRLAARITSTTVLADPAGAPTLRADSTSIR